MKKRAILKYIIITGVALMCMALVVVVGVYSRVYKKNTTKSTYVYIPSGADFDTVVKIMKEAEVLKNINSFIWLAKKKNYPNHIYSGKYKIEGNTNNNDLINKFRSGHQEPVKVIFNSVRTLSQLAGKIARQIEPDSVTLLQHFYNGSIIQNYGLKRETISCIFLPNTYEFWWNCSAATFMNKMHKEYMRFWNTNRKNQAKAINLTPQEVITLASIVDEETLYNDEMPRVAGVYINRLKKRMHLQADPTLKFALGDFSIKRVLNRHKKIDSPYNTYKRYGLPPGPISIPSIAAIKAVLNYETHNFLYFCAKPDFSGYHNFAKTLSKHNINARNYQRALNKQRIWR